jgi:hypothetical protein
VRILAAITLVCLALSACGPGGSLSRYPPPPAGSFTPVTVRISIGGTAEATPGALVKRDFFPGTGVMPLLGRLFADADWTQGANRLVALSEDFWRQRFGAGPDIIGTSIEVDGAPATIICVLPRGFDAPPGAKFWYSEPLRAPAPDNR